MFDDFKKASKSSTDDLITESLQHLDASKEAHLASEAISRYSENLSESGDEEAFEHLSDTEIRRRETLAKVSLQQYVEKEVYMRLAADFDNFRKRALRERTEWEKNSKEKVFRGFLDVLDNLIRGLDQASGDSSALAEGMKMVLGQAEAWLKSEGLHRIESVGKVFNPQLHEAVGQRESDEVPEGSVIEELRRGYSWEDRLIRPASVIVSMGKLSS
ncbi:MAG: nucleotide exchange factor GrpE [Bdellovibrionota bacterium]